MRTHPRACEKRTETIKHLRLDIPRTSMEYSITTENIDGDGEDVSMVDDYEFKHDLSYPVVRFVGGMSEIRSKCNANLFLGDELIKFPKPNRLRRKLSPDAHLCTRVFRAVRLLADTPIAHVGLPLTCLSCSRPSHRKPSRHLCHLPIHRTEYGGKTLQSLLTLLEDRIEQIFASLLFIAIFMNTVLGLVHHDFMATHLNNILLSSLPSTNESFRDTLSRIRVIDFDLATFSDVTGFGSLRELITCYREAGENDRISLIKARCPDTRTNRFVLSVHTPRSLTIAMYHLDEYLDNLPVDIIH